MYKQPVTDAATHLFSITSSDGRLTLSSNCNYSALFSRCFRSLLPSSWLFTVLLPSVLLHNNYKHDALLLDFTLDSLHYTLPYKFFHKYQVINSTKVQQREFLN